MSALSDRLRLNDAFDLLSAHWWQVGGVLVAIGLLGAAAGSWWASRAAGKPGQWGAAATTTFWLVCAAAGLAALTTGFVSDELYGLAMGLVALVGFTLSAMLFALLSRRLSATPATPTIEENGHEVPRRPGWIYRDSAETYYLVAHAPREVGRSGFLLLRLPEFAAVTPTDVVFPLVPTGPGEISVQETVAAN